MTQFDETQLSAEDQMSLRSGVSAFEAKHFSSAMQLLSPIAELGHPDSQYRVAIMFQNGLGMAVNQVQALKWMQASAEQGYALAQHGLGFMYMQGECVEQSNERALHWFKLAAEQGLSGAQTIVDMLEQKQAS